MRALRAFRLKPPRLLGARTKARMLQVWAFVAVRALFPPRTRYEADEAGCTRYEAGCTRYDSRNRFARNTSPLEEVCVRLW